MKNLIPYNSDNLQLIIDSHHGIYQGKIFAELFTVYLTEEQKSDLSNPDNEFYWETFAEVIDNIKIKDDKGIQHSFIQIDGDLFAYPSNMELPEDLF